MSAAPRPPGRNPRYDLLFEPVRIGPVVARNRFYQVPHATGTGCAMPHTRAGMREVRAEGGWAVVCTGYCSIHPSSDDTPLPYASLWDDADIEAQSVMVEAVHRHGALAGVELWHGGAMVSNRLSRAVPLSPSGLGGSAWSPYPSQSREMDRDDIGRLRAWHRAAALRARQAGFDIVYVYAGMGYLPFQFLLSRYNRRTDGYGGAFENRARLLAELIDDTREATGGHCAVAVRLTAEEGMGAQGFRGAVEGRALLEHLGEAPDLWDVKLGFDDDASSSRFSGEAYQEDAVRYVKQFTDKPVVGVGRLTSPDTMVRLVRQGTLDLVGAARPSIADPFLPSKIDAGREDDIRECIGCNVCIAHYSEGAPIRCTQNPTMGEEWRRGWHPERIPARGSADTVLIVGAGPAGLECARALGQRGYAVTLAEASKELGGRVAAESGLPGLAAWVRVRDYRVGQIERTANVAVYLESPMTAADIVEFGAERVVVATGATWQPDLYDPVTGLAVPAGGGCDIVTPDRVMAGHPIRGPAVVLDFEPYSMGASVAEKLCRDGLAVTVVTPAAMLSPWAAFTGEQGHLVKRLRGLGARIAVRHAVIGGGPDEVEIVCLDSAERRHLPCGTLVVVGNRRPNAALYDDLLGLLSKHGPGGIKSVQRIGDCDAPGTIAHAVHAGHLYARMLDATAAAVRREPLVRERKQPPAAAAAGS